MIIGTCIMYRLWCWCTYRGGGDGGTGGYLDWQVLRAPRYVNPALAVALLWLLKVNTATLYSISKSKIISCQLNFTTFSSEQYVGFPISDGIDQLNF